MFSHSLSGQMDKLIGLSQTRHLRHLQEAYRPLVTLGSTLGVMGGTPVTRAPRTGVGFQPVPLEYPEEHRICYLLVEKVFVKIW